MQTNAFTRICILGLRGFILNSYKLINLKMSTESIQLLLSLPEALRLSLIGARFSTRKAFSRVRAPRKRVGWSSRKASSRKALALTAPTRRARTCRYVQSIPRPSHTRFPACIEMTTDIAFDAAHQVAVCVRCQTCLRAPPARLRILVGNIPVGNTFAPPPHPSTFVFCCSLTRVIRRTSY